MTAESPETYPDRKLYKHGVPSYLAKREVGEFKNPGIRVFQNSLTLASPEDYNDDGLTQFHIAVIKGDTEKVRNLVAKKPNVLYEVTNTDNQYAPLHLACYHGKENMVKLLLLLGSNANDKTAVDEKQPIHYACVNGNVNIVEALINARSDVNTICKDDNMVPLHFASANNHLQVVQVLLDNRGHRFINSKTLAHEQTALHFACDNANFEMVQLLLQNGADVNLCTIDMYEDENGEIVYDTDKSALHLACDLQDDRSDLVHLLLDNKANINTKDIHGKTPLITACDWGHENVVSVLLNKGAKVNETDYYGNTALHYAIRNIPFMRYTFLRVCELLIRAYADVKIKNADEATPIDEANLILEIMGKRKDRYVPIIDKLMQQIKQREDYERYYQQQRGGTQKISFYVGGKKRTQKVHINKQGCRCVKIKGVLVPINTL